jgi:hypothetical protein
MWRRRSEFTLFFVADPFGMGLAITPIGTDGLDCSRAGSVYDERLAHRLAECVTNAAVWFDLRRRRIDDGVFVFAQSVSHALVMGLPRSGIDLNQFRPRG